MFKSLVKPFFILAGACTAAIIFILVNTIIDFSFKLGQFHTYLQWGFLAITMALFIIYILVPFIKIMLYPKYIPPPDHRKDKNYFDYLWYLRNNLICSPALSKNEIILKKLKLADKTRQGELEDAVKEAILFCSEEADNLIKDTAFNVGIFTALSQSGRIDALILLVNNIRMTNKLIAFYRQRPAVVELFKLYAIAGGSAFLADQIEDADLNELVADSLQSLGLSGLPVPILGKALDMVGQGAFNALLTLRIGYSVKNACGALDAEAFASAIKTGRKEAYRKIPAIILDLKNKIFGGLKQKSSNLFAKFADLFGKT